MVGVGCHPVRNVVALHDMFSVPFVSVTIAFIAVKPSPGQRLRYSRRSLFEWLSLEESRSGFARLVSVAVAVSPAPSWVWLKSCNRIAGMATALAPKHVDFRSTRSLPLSRSELISRWLPLSDVGW